MQIQGKWYAHASARSLDALLSVHEKRFQLEIDSEIKYEADISALEVSPRLGNTQRKITLEDASHFSTLENDEVDRLFESKFVFFNLLYILESKLKWIFLALLLTLLIVFSFFKWGIPWSSKQIAQALPQDVNRVISKNSLEVLDTYIFKPSKISKKQQEDIRHSFYSKIAPLESRLDPKELTLHFRLWKDTNLSVPNAFALPSGAIILTDKFVELCKSQDEIDSILLHEMGHIVHKHNLVMLIESAFVAVSVMVIIGDSNALADMGLGLGSLIMSSGYSRGHEAEADSYAFKKMLAAKINPNAFTSIMNRMELYMKKNSVIEEDKEEESSLLDYLSSHPNTTNRVAIAQKYAECFKKGLTECEILKDK